MSSKPTQQSRVAPLQRVEALPITDPAEIAAIEARIAEWKRRQHDLPHTNGEQPTPAGVLRWCDALTEEERLEVAVNLLGRVDTGRLLQALPASVRVTLEAAQRVGSP